MDTLKKEYIINRMKNIIEQLAEWHSEDDGGNQEEIYRTYMCCVDICNALKLPIDYYVIQP